MENLVGTKVLRNVFENKPIPSDSSRSNSRQKLPLPRCRVQGKKKENRYPAADQHSCSDSCRNNMQRSFPATSRGMQFLLNFFEFESLGSKLGGYPVNFFGSSMCGNTTAHKLPR
ncbi:hypothetical protein EYR41_004826 [Orbilia oligospora]|uniref:Uncharacterized protein n=1 Tax=Orbilia oligospora TaxID=2813651 RepID=A0A8H2E134_ORBOL|nr:hypothetical protein EYR41_004826 [Orbilia oligospora]